MTLLVNYQSNSQIQVTLSFPDTQLMKTLKEKRQNIPAAKLTFQKLKRFKIWGEKKSV